MKKVWVVLFDNSPECGSPIRVRAVYDSEEKARKGFEKCLRANWDELTKNGDEDFKPYDDFDTCIKELSFNNFHYGLYVEEWKVNEDWEGSIFDDY